jgi:RHS repeat-associated protein
VEDTSTRRDKGGQSSVSGTTNRDVASSPALSLPKGGGAIRGIGEKFAANPVTGTGSLTLPIFASPGRSGFSPQFALSYDSGSGNGPFGFGWSLALPSITRKTDKGLPRYEDAGESDVFILSGAEDLMPALTESAGQWIRGAGSLRSLYGRQYAIHPYRPRIEGLFARIERWINISDPSDAFWRSISKDNVTTWYGKTANSRVCDPSDSRRVFSWLMCESYDDKGNVISYEYKPEDSTGVDQAKSNERNRTGTTRSANRYIKHVFYGNRTPYFPQLSAESAVALPSDWMFELVFDYGEHDLLDPVPQDTAAPWTCRLDPFSTFRSGFEVRTYRLCRRALMFHQFPGTEVGADCLVRSTDFSHTSVPPTNPSQPFFSYLLSVTVSGYTRNGAAGYFSSSMPPVEFGYTEAIVDETVREVDQQSLANLPYGLGGEDYRWVDLDGEGLSGILTEQAGSWFYKANLSAANRQIVGGTWYTLPRFAPVQLVSRLPSTASLHSGHQQLFSVSGDGQLDLVNYDGATPGYFERTEDAGWQPFVPFASLPKLDWNDPELKFIDLTGDGFPDVLISEGDDIRWYQSSATIGFTGGQRIPQSFDEELGPRFIFSDSTVSVFLADMSGDGLTDLVRIRNGEMCYWPNLGYGKFGAKISMDYAPRFDRPDLFDGRRIHLADIDGSGTTDMVYFANNSVQLYFNQSGNSWGPARVLNHFPAIDSISSATVLDFLGNGTACLVWSSSLPGNARQPMRYIDLMGGQKPHLLVSTNNNLGSESVIQYAPSTKFYVADKLAGTPWVTRLPFPVHVVERVQTYDYVSRNLFVARYAYHHGYYDGVEREFRGFGRVDQWDAEEFATLTDSVDLPSPTNVDQASNIPPICTKTWFHTGAYFGEAGISTQMRQEYYMEGDSSSGIAGLPSAQAVAMLLDDSVLPASILMPDGTRLPYPLSPEELREASRALRGSILRQEIYGLDGTQEADRPYSVSERNHTIEVLQPQGPNLYGVFFTHSRETINFQYERKLFKVVGNTIVDPSAPPPAKSVADPRVTHSFSLAVDQYGNELQSVQVGYGRRYLDPNLSAADQAKQTSVLATYSENQYTNAVASGDVNRTPLPAQTASYELLQILPSANQAAITNLFKFAELQATVQSLSDGTHDLSFDQFDPTGLTAGQVYRRLIGCARTYYRPDDMGESAGDAKALLGLGVLESLALPGKTCTLAFNKALIPGVYQRGAEGLLTNPVSVLPSIASDGGGYTDLDSDGNWWIPSGRAYYIDSPPSFPQELAQAKSHFFLSRRSEDPFGNASTVAYDGNDLLPVETTDAVNNVVAVSNDYRVLAPVLLTDANGNQAAASFDTLGLVAGTALMGKSGQNQGDVLTGFSADIPQSQTDGFYDANDPHDVAAPLLGNATTRVVYDVNRFYTTRSANPMDPTKWLPCFAATISRETHYYDLASGQQSRLQIDFGYSDGLGREIQKKIQAEPTPASTGTSATPRWVGSGWTIFNNKAKPVRQYEPFFSQLPKGHQFEFGVQAGVSPIVCYDPAGRAVATLHPNQTYEKISFDPWYQQTFDVNDTVLQTDPKGDPDVGDFFQRLPSADYLPTWHTLRTDPAYAGQAAVLWPDPQIRSAETAAAMKAAAHANTPTLAYLDTLGRVFLTIADNGPDGKFATHVELDIQGNQRSVTDALGREVVTYDYDMLGTRIHQSSMEAGQRWMLNDVAGRSIRAWDSRGHDFRTTYDSLRRATGLYVQGTDAVNSDPRTTAAEVLFQKTVYGEGQPAALNLHTRVWQSYDSSGMVTNTGHASTGQDEGYDFKGNLLRSTRQFLVDYKALPDWTGTPALMAETFAGSTRYDALNRPTSATAPDGSVVVPSYNEANFLETLSVNLGGAATATPFVTNIDYNAKGQRVLVQYGNGVLTQYNYDQRTFRLVRLTTTRQAFPSNQQTVQDLAYSYDPAGSITHIQDDADMQNTVFFRNQRIEPSNDYTYDAIYRLIQATGREQLGLDNNGQPFAPWPSSYNDVPRVLLNPSPTDGNAMGTYTETYQYDAAGNFLQLAHSGSQPSNPGWTRTYTYGDPSLLEPGRVGNRLTRSAISGNQPLNELYTHDVHGNMTSMPQLQAMQWDFKDELLITRRQRVNAGDSDGVQHEGQQTYYVYDSSGQRARKVTESSAGIKIKERFYLGSYEVYREYDGNGAIALERETLHVTDDKQRLALVETRTQGSDGSPAQLVRYQFSNHLGSASLELDDQGQIISYEEYCPYGNTSYQAGRSKIEVSLKRYRYTGMERDEESGLSYHSARYYAGWIGRWLSCDPSGVSGGVNLYSYGASSPVRFLDTSGNEPGDGPLVFPVSREFQGKYGLTQTLPRHIGNKHKGKPGGGGTTGKKGSNTGPAAGVEGGEDGGVAGGDVGGHTGHLAQHGLSEQKDPGKISAPGSDGGTDQKAGGTDDAGTGDSGKGGQGTGQTGTNGKGQSGSKQGNGRTSGSPDGTPDAPPDDGSGKGGKSTFLGDLAELASFLIDPDSLYEANHSGNSGTGSQVGSKSGIIKGWLAQVLVIAAVIGSSIAKLFRRAGGLLKGGLKRLFGKVEQKALEAGAEKFALAEGASFLAAVKDGEILAQTADINMSHAEFVARKFPHGTPEGTYVLTVFKEEGVVHAFTSRGVHGSALPAPQAVIDTIRRYFK